MHAVNSTINRIIKQAINAGARQQFDAMARRVQRPARPRPVVVRYVTVYLEPAVRAEMVADLGLEADLLVDAHAACLSARLRTSIWPVTAAEIKAVRRSWRRLMARCASATRESIRSVSRSRYSTISFCSEIGAPGVGSAFKIGTLIF